VPATIALLPPWPAARRLGLATVLATLPAIAAPSGLSIEDAIHEAWKTNPGLAASSAQVQAARAEAERDGRIPQLVATARAVATDEPAGVFGLRLDQQKITATDFDPAKLNAPAPAGGIGLGASVVQPIYMGGRITAARRAQAYQAEAEEHSHERRTQEMAAAVVQAYFGAQAAGEALRHAEELLAHAQETERFVAARAGKGLVLDADVARATAFRAQAEAERVTAQQRLASARSALALLSGDAAEGAELISPIARPSSAPQDPTAPAAELEPGSVERTDVQAARLRASAAEEAITATRGTLPEIFAQGGVETMRASLDQGATWFNVALVARWKFDFSDLKTTKAAEARAAAAEKALRWQELQARNEVAEARRAVLSADARVTSAHDAVVASESARDLRIARHRQGLLPLTDVLDAEAALAGARALLLRSQLEARVARAQLQLALGEAVEGVRA
jgi:outer membrane protein TolC